MARKDANIGKKEGAAKRRLTALELRIAGVGYQGIARQLNVSISQSYKDVQESLRLLNEQELELVGELRQLESERLDVALKAIFPAVIRGNFAAVDRLIKISERRSKLYGLDAPVVQNQEVTVTYPIVDPEVLNNPELRERRLRELMERGKEEDFGIIDPTN